MSENPHRIQRKRTKGWTMPENTVAIGRGTEWGNPFRVVKYTAIKAGDADRWAAETDYGVWWADSKIGAQARAVELFTKWLGLPQNARLRERARIALRGKNLACWCAEGTPCHADVLLEIVNAG